jgi:predicted phage tail component-like protein
MSGKNYYNRLYFNGKDLSEFGLKCSGDGVFNAPEKDYTVYEVPGRNGDIYVSNGRYKNISVTYPCFVIGHGEDKFADFALKMQGLRAWLLKPDTYVRIEDTYHPDEYRMGVFQEGIDLEAQYLQSGEFDLTFQCKPQRFLKSGEKIIKFEGDTTFENTDAIYNPTPFASKPMIHIVRKTEGVGVTLNIGAGFVDINAVCPYGDIIIDCERMDAYTGPTVEDAASVNPYILMDSFPEIDPGKNEVWRSNIDYVEVIPRWWVL